MNHRAACRPKPPPPPKPPAGMDYPFPERPQPGGLVEVGPGVFWLRMPLPFALDHINLWLLEDGDGWTIVDTGICRDEVKALWRELLAGPMAGRPVKRVIVTHFHPDHVGLAGWLAAELAVAVWMSQTEWLMAALLHGDELGEVAGRQVAFYRRHGLAEDWLEPVAARGNAYRKRVSAPPPAYRRIVEGEVIDVGGRGWRVIVGTGHAPEHACLYCESLGILISGDQILPKITPNVSVFATEPDANPLKLYLDSLQRFRPLPAGTLVLPSHGLPFLGLSARLDHLRVHHDARLDEVLAACTAPRSAAEIIPVLFRRTLDSHQITFAMGESLAHLAYLSAVGRLRQEHGADGVVRFAPAED